MDSEAWGALEKSMRSFNIFIAKKQRMKKALLGGMKEGRGDQGTSTQRHPVVQFMNNSMYDFRWETACHDCAQAFECETVKKGGQRGVRRRSYSHRCTATMSDIVPIGSSPSL
jgi:hypothetical protein